MIKITFPDGSVREYNEGVNGLQIAESISSRLAQDVLACGVNGEIYDLGRPINEDASVVLYKWEDEQGKHAFGTQVLTCWLKLCRSFIRVFSSVLVRLLKTVSTMTLIRERLSSKSLICLQLRQKWLNWLQGKKLWFAGILQKRCFKDVWRPWGNL